MIGIKQFFAKAENQIIADATLITVGLSTPIAAGQSMKIRAWVPVTVGATGGVRSQLIVPANGVLLRVSTTLYNTVAPSLATAISNTGAVFTNALANAGTHWLLIEATIVNGVTPGSIDLQLAQNTTDALTLTVLRGALMGVTIY